MNVSYTSGDRLAFVLWILLIVGFALGSLSRQLTWLLALIALPVLTLRYRELVDLPDWRRMSGWWLLATVPMVVALPDAVDVAGAGRTLWRFFSYWLAGSLLFLLTPAPDRQRSLMLLSGGLLVVLLGDGVLQALLGHNLAGFPLYEDSRYGYRVTGFLGVDFGWVMAVLSPFVLEAARLADTRGRLYWLALPLLLVAVMLSGSRASLLLMGIGWCLYGVQLTHRLGAAGLYRFLAPLSVGLLIGVATVLLSDDLSRRWADASGLFSTQAQSLNEALSLRPQLWSAGVAVFSDHWVNGVGVRGFGTVAAPMLESIEGLPEKPQGWTPHLAILEVATDLGLIGLAAYLVLYAKLLTWLWRAPITALAPGLAAALALFPLGSTLPLYSMRVAGMAWVCIALALAIARRDGKSSGGSAACAA